MSIFRDRPEILQRIKRQRAARWIGTLAGAIINVRSTHTGVETLIAETPKVRTTEAGVETLIVETPAVRSTQSGIELLMVYQAVTTKYVPHIYEDYV